MSHYTSFTADTLRNSSARLQEIEMHVSDIIKSFNIEIKDAHEAGADHIDTTMTNTFSIPYMRPSDATTHIHYKIVSNFHNRGFRIYIEDRDVSTRVVIAWFTSRDIKRLKKEKELLDFCRIPLEKRNATDKNQELTDKN